MKTPEQMARELCKDWPKEVYHGDLVIFFVKGFEAAIEQEARLIEQTESNESSASAELARLRSQLERVVREIRSVENEYLSNGGLFNPECMDPEELGQSIMDIAKLARQVAKEEGIEI